MPRFALLLALATALLVPDVAGAQATTLGETQLRLEREQRRVIVAPSPSIETVERDAEAAEQRQRQHDIVRDLARPLSRRPDLDYDVKSGIQSQRLNDALRSR